VGVKAQQAVRVIGFLHANAQQAASRFFDEFKSGLQSSGYVEGRNVRFEERYAEGRPDRLPALAQDLVSRKVALIATGGAEFPALAAQTATLGTDIPVVFVIGGDPVKLKLVASLARPTGNITGIAMFTSALESKRFGLLHEIVPTAKTIAAMVDQSRAVFQVQLAELNDAAAQAGVLLVVVNTTKPSEYDAAFARASTEGATALQICANPTFLAMRHQLVALASRHRIPTMYEWRDFVEVGGLMSYGTDLRSAYRNSGIYAGKVLSGIKPSDLPIMQASKFEFVLNSQTARAQGVEFSPTILARADEVIE
jgi:putative ABC transport system substrate-binding protein